MNRFTFCLLTALFSIAPVGIFGAPVPKNKLEDMIKEDIAKLEGKWRIVSYQIDGVERDAGYLADSPVLTFTGRDYKWSNGATAGTIEEIDPSEFPKKIAYKMEGAEKGTIDYGIYMVVGDIFVDCFGRSEKERPKDFVSKPDSGHSLVVYKRIKNEKE